MYNIEKKRHRGYRKDIDLTGSLNQGSISASFFEVHDPSSNPDYITIDLDSQIISNITLREDCLVDIKEKPDNLRIKSQCFTNIRHRLLGNPLDDGEFATSYRFKEWARKRLKLGPDRIDFGWTIDRQEIKLTKATTRGEGLVTLEDGLKVNVEIDFASLFMLNFTHPLTKQFQKRTKYDLPYDLTSRSYVMAKTSHEEKHNINSTEWSHSFSFIEDYIFTEIFSNTHKLIHLICKSIFKRELAPLDGDKMTSYIIKTLILWRFENKTFDDWDWENQSKIWKEVRLLYMDFVDVLEKGFLPSYFVPQTNIIKYLDNNLREKAIEKIQYILPNLQTLIGVEEIKTVNEHLETAGNLLSALKHCAVDLNIPPFPSDSDEKAMALCFRWRTQKP